MPDAVDVTVADLHAALRLLAELSDRIDAERGRLSTAQEAQRLVSRLRAELERSDPEPEQARGLMAKLLDSVRPVSELAGLVAAVGNALSSLSFFR